MKILFLATTFFFLSAAYGLAAEHGHSHARGHDAGSGRSQHGHYTTRDHEYKGGYRDHGYGYPGLDYDVSPCLEFRLPGVAGCLN
jgi:hypothetical protein